MQAALGAHHLHRLLHGVRHAVHAVAGERVEDVGHRHDPPLDRDLLAREAARVTAAVPLLVMAQRDRGGHVEDRGGGAPQQPVALLGVGLHDRALLRGERAGLQQDRVGDRDLAHVVQGGRIAEALAELPLEADPLGEQRREAPDPFDVRAGVLVAELDRHREAPHGLRLRDLELRERPVQLARAVVDLALQLLAATLPGTPAEQAGGGGEHGYVDHGEGRALSEDRPERGSREHRRDRSRGTLSHPRFGQRPGEQRTEAAASHILGDGLHSHTFEVSDPSSVPPAIRTLG